MRRLMLVILAALLPLATVAAPVRIKDLADFDGVRGNDLVGYGLVVGLDGTGDGFRNAPFTEELLAGLLERLGVNVTDEALRSRNVAAVVVTATLPPFARSGSRIDVNVATIGDAKSLLGGTLVMTPLKAADGNIYAVAQGSIIASGAAVEGEAARVVEGVAKGLDRLSHGQLAFRLNDPFAPEYEGLRADFNAAMDKLQGVMRVIVERAAAIGLDEALAAQPSVQGASS